MTRSSNTTATKRTQGLSPGVLSHSQTKVPTICKILPLFKAIQHHIRDTLNDSDLTRDTSGLKYSGLKSGLKASLKKLDIHLEKALIGDYPLLGASELSMLML
jgi:hypothetical protein